MRVFLKTSGQGMRRAMLVAFVAAIVVAIVASAGAVSAEMSLGKVTWEGVDAFSTDDLAHAAKLKRGLSWAGADGDAARARLLEIYRTEGFFEASVEFGTRERSGEIDLRVHISEGPRYKVGRVSFEGGSLLTSDDVFDLCPGLRSGAVFSLSGIESSFDLLLRLHGERGYADCRISPSSFSPNPGGTVDFFVQIIEGTRYGIEDVVVVGGRTRGETAARIAGLEQGQPFDPWKLEDARAKLAGCGLFSRVGELAVRSGSADSLVVIEVDLDEAPSSSASGLLGYSGREGGAVGFVDLKLGNILGTARSGSFRWENSGGGLSLYGARYKEPWLAGLPLALELGIDHVAQDTTYSTTSILGGIRVSVGRRLSFTLGASKERTAVMGEREGTAVRRSRIAVRAGAEIDARDSAFDPRRGFKIIAAGDWGSRTDTQTGALESSSWRITRLNIGAEIYRRLSGRHGLYANTEWRKIVTDEAALPWDQLLRFGGAGSLRGYREDQFRAEETGLAQLEHRVALGEGSSRLFLFSDFGFLRGRGAPKDLLIGYGLGIRAVTSGGIVGLDYGLGKGDSWSEGKIHVRLTRTF